MKKNRITICGRNTSTLPTPVMIPSVSRFASMPSGRVALTTPLSASNPSLIHSIGSAAHE